MKWNRRKSLLVLSLAAAALLLLVLVLGAAGADAALVTDFTRKNQPPSWQYPFGTDWLGRDMFARTLTGLSMSIRLGVLTASVSALVALALGAAALLGRRADACVSFLIDLVLGLPHILLLLLVSFALGRGVRGVAVGIVLTHWMSLARLLRGEMLQLSQSLYVQTAAKLGVSRLRIVTRHLLPHLAPQFGVGLVLLLPHAILHEAGITFLGFGFSPEQPAIGVILSESMRYLVTGSWWLAVFPGLALVATVLLFDAVGTALRTLLDPVGAQG